MLLSSTVSGVLMDGAVDKGDEEKLMELFRKVCKRSDGPEASSPRNLSDSYNSVAEETIG